MARSADQEKTATEKMVYCSDFPRREGFATPGGACGEAPGSMKGQRGAREPVGKSHDGGPPRKE